LEWAIQLQKKMDELFWDGKSGGYYSVDGKDQNIVLRLKEDYDGSEPSNVFFASLKLHSNVLFFCWFDATLNRNCVFDTLSFFRTRLQR
jgi:uncharacterized protein YyaL (SSP411 family)